MPKFHNPLFFFFFAGRTIDLAQRRAVIEVMSRTSVPDLEDEYQLPLTLPAATTCVAELDRSARPNGHGEDVSKGRFPAAQGRVQAAGAAAADDGVNGY